MSRVLLFGASGFVGGRVRAVLEPDTELTCPGRAECDLLAAEVAELAELVHAARPDAVVNCTGQLTGGADTMIRAHTLVTAKLIEAIAVAAPRARLVRLGSAGEYGPVPFGAPVAEDEPAAPVSEYGLSHLAGTQLVELARSAGRIDAVVLRVFNPIGPGLSTENVLGRAAALLLAAAETGTPEIGLGSLGAYRDFVDVRDVAFAVRAAIGVPEPPQFVFNISSGHAVATRHAVRMLARTAGFTGTIREEAPAASAARTANVPWMCGDNSLALRVLGWAPAHDLVDSVRDLWDAAVAAATGIGPDPDRTPLASGVPA
ncbi:NAD-dependent epimerase/dehydratase family protein [Micromonospora sp. NPDC049523]|uniref:NAD-dependent epimerase/dehydratase family protein n=1 Tax=Micromonospora sp. NPDC049523 TaxID=3155921 RepID=UPI003427453A